MDKRIYRRYLKLPLFGAIYATIAIIGFGIYQAYAIQSLMDSLEFKQSVNTGNSLALNGFSMTLLLSPFYFCGFFISFFLMNWIARLIFYSIHFMESHSNNEAN